MSETNAARPHPARPAPEWARARPSTARSWRTRICGTLFDGDPDRAERYTLQVGDLHLDYSKHLVTDETLRLLRELAAATGVAELRDAMFRGEQDQHHRGPRGAAHRAARPAAAIVERRRRRTSCPAVHAVLDKMAVFADRIRSGEWTGHTGKRIRNIVNIGIGGSDLGPGDGLRGAAPLHRPRPDAFRFVSNVDGADLHEAVRDLDAAETLFIVASKTFTTIETITNATSARDWLLERLGAGDEAVAKHFVALSTNAEKVAEFGIDTENMFEFWDWVGGRYSYDSAIGLSLMIAIGPDALPRDAGRLPPGRRALPHRPAGGERAAAAGPARHLVRQLPRRPVARGAARTATTSRRFTAYLQQLDMESNGKSVDRDGKPVGLADRPGRLGHAGHQRPARLLPAAAPGHQADPGRLHRLRPAGRRTRRRWPASTTC